MDTPLLLLLVAAFGAFANWYAWKSGYFFSPSFQEPSSVRLKISSVIGLFALYLACTLLLSPLIIILFRSSFASEPILMINWTQLFTTSLSILLLFVFSRAFIDPSSLSKIWKDRSYPHARSIGYDFRLGLLTWLLAFPLVMVVGELSDWFIHEMLGAENYEQVAVVYLKMTRERPSMLIVALSIILVAAPCIEEYLFRGILQNWLRQHLGPKAAILLASMAFAFFHAAPSQGWGNISLIASLFVFACFLGFVYEKQRSLFASIGLHMAFNVVSALRILSLDT